MGCPTNWDSQPAIGSLAEAAVKGVELPAAPQMVLLHPLPILEWGRGRGVLSFLTLSWLFRLQLVLGLPVAWAGLVSSAGKLQVAHPNLNV